MIYRKKTSIYPCFFLYSILYRREVPVLDVTYRLFDFYIEIFFLYRMVYRMVYTIKKHWFYILPSCSKKVVYACFSMLYTCTYSYGNTIPVPPSCRGIQEPAAPEPPASRSEPLLTIETIRMVPPAFLQMRLGLRERWHNAAFQVGTSRVQSDSQLLGQWVPDTSRKMTRTVSARHLAKDDSKSVKCWPALKYLRSQPRQARCTLFP